MRVKAASKAGFGLLVLLPMLVGSGASAQDAQSAQRHRLDLVLAVLRADMKAAGKSCLAAMTQVHQTEDQVADLGKEQTNTNKTDNDADVARDVLESDYEAAQNACRPDAASACAQMPTIPACAAIR